MSNDPKQMTALEVLTVIARGYDLYPMTRAYRRLPRMEIIGMARAVCDRFGVTYAQRDLMDGEDDHNVEGATAERQAAGAGEGTGVEVSLVSDDHDADAAASASGQAVSEDHADVGSSVSSKPSEAPRDRVG